MIKLLSLHNYRDKTYRYVVITCILSMLLIGDILSPVLNYIAVSLPKGYNQFNNYATIASIAPSLPFMLSVLISYVINNLPYIFLVKTIFIISTLAALVMLNLSITNFILLTLIIVLISFCYRALYFSLDRQLSTILVDRIHDFQSDLSIWGGLIGAFGVKFSGYLYTEYHLTGILWCFVIGNILLFYCASKIPPVSQVEQSLSPANQLPEIKKASIKFSHDNNFIQLLKTIFNYPALIKYLTLMFFIMLFNGAGNILLMSKIHHDQIVVNQYASLMALATTMGILGAIISKFKWLKQFSTQGLTAISIILSSICIIGLGITSSTTAFAIYYLSSITVGSIMFINMNSLLFRHIRRSNQLVQISPFVNGLVASLFYAGSLIGQLCTNLALNHELSYQTIYIFIGSITIILAVLLFRLKNQPGN